VVTGDDARLRQVATNLVTNAVRHAGPDAHVWVSVRAVGDWAELEVRDDGAGMSAGVAERVFEPFFTGVEAAGLGAGSGRGDVQAAADETSRGAPADAAASADGDVVQDRVAGPGLPKNTTGLGLAIALSIARAHGGSIDLETSPGIGTRFVVRLPQENGIWADSAGEAEPGSGSAAVAADAG
jgi:two-component system OmpR family sensor kinase